MSLGGGFSKSLNDAVNAAINKVYACMIPILHARDIFTQNFLQHQKARKQLCFMATWFESIKSSLGRVRNSNRLHLTLQIFLWSTIEDGILL